MSTITEAKKKRYHQEQAFTKAYKELSKGMTAYAFSKVHDHSISNDLVQSAFMKAWRYVERGGTISILKAFLYHILNNLIVDEYRRKRLVSLDVLIEKGYEPAADDSELFSDVLDIKTASNLIQQLPEMYQKVATMRYIHGLSLAEMSKITGKSKNTLAVHAHRGLSKLRRLYTVA